MSAAPASAESNFAPQRSTRMAGRWLVALVLLAWALAMLGLFKYFFASETGANNLGIAHFAPDLLPATPHLGAVSAVYFLDSNCPCSRGAIAQIDSLQRRHGAALRQFVVMPAGQKLPALTAVGQLDAAQIQALQNAVPALPAAALWDAAGKLVYFGPLTAGFDCGSGGNFVSSNVRRLRDGLAPIPTPMDATGCFCSSSKHIATYN